MFYFIGIIRHLEVMTQTPVHWIICLLHMNELPFRALFIHLDGVTLGPHLFKGPIGKMLPDSSKQPICGFERFFSDDLPVLPDEVLKDLSTDQKYLYEICHAIQIGSCSSSLAMKNPGTLVHSRFLTTANAILRCYMSQEKPTMSHKLMVKFIITVYAPS